MSQDALKPAAELAAASPARFPNESADYRAARTALLAEEIELRRHIARVAKQRRALPPGGEIAADYRFEGENGPTTLSALFGDKDTLIVYSLMYGPQRQRACPMCTAQLSAWDGEARHIEKRVALAVVARSPAKRILAFGRERGWRNLKLYSDPSGDFTADYVGERDADWPAYTVFRKDGDGRIRHFYSSEGGPEVADPGQDPHNAPDMNPLWILLDTTPGGRGADWYPRLDD
ncbi:DUF899 family protein [Aureimonas leprariae]|uniref:DUF899 domain-containing protein n=1 Tax=Plantimonas leprariae TaxID=2615207 RepID=A0A7V7U174_9HYPH|nr:DUF899 family protein [Aureimonas leprariae]KAB0681467.1 DUF899 domain-containing protein [Aureimonas leprariae]